MGIHFASKACAPLNVPLLLTQAVSNNSLFLNFQSTSNFTNCPLLIEVEIACINQPFTMITQAIFISPPYTYTSLPGVYPQYGISLAYFCPEAYKFRYRERNISNGSFSAWSATGYFNVPGIPNVANAYITSNTPYLCPPQSTTLTANVLIDCGLTPYTYSWEPAGLVSCINCSNTVVSPTITTTYTVFITGGQLGCWTASASITIPIGPIAPAIGLASSFPATGCIGGTAIIGLNFVNGSISWQTSPNYTGPWSYIPGGNQYNVTTNTLSTQVYYRALVTGCFITDSSNVVVLAVFPTPTVTVNSPIICPGATATLVANGAAAYVWSNGAFPSGANTGGAAPVVTTQYTVTGTTSACSATALATVTVDTYPIPVVNNQTICANRNLVLNAIGGLTYKWDGPLGYTSLQQSPTIINILPNMSGEYTLTAFSQASCATAVISTITVLAVISPTISYNNPCNGASLSFTASGAQSYTWAGPNSFNSYTTNPFINPINYANSGVYTLTGSVGACTGSITTFINVQAPPTPTALNSSPVCNGFPVSFTALGANTYTWSGPSGFVTTVQNPTISNMYLNNAGGYTLAATALNGCITSVVSDVTVHPQPIIPVINLTVCLNAPINLSSGGGQSYLWTGPQGFTSQLQNPTIQSASFPLSGQYSVTVTTAEGCSNTAVTTVTVISLPVINIIAPATICEGYSLSLSGIGGVNYAWTGPNNFSSNQQNTGIATVSLNSSGIYSLSGTLGSCTGIATKSIQVLPVPLITINTNSVCDARELVLVPSGGISYEWFAPNGVDSKLTVYNVPVVSLANAGIYTLVATAANHCSLTITFLVYVLPNPTLTATGATVCAGQSAVLTSTGNGISYEWKGPGFYSATPQTIVPNVNVMSAGIYTAIVRAANSCTTGFDVNVDVIAIPQASIIATQTVCFNDVINLQGSGGETYRWDGPFDFSSNLQIVTFSASSIGLSGTYTLSAINKSGCVGIATTDVKILSIPEGQLTSNNNLHCVPFCSEFGFSNKNNVALLYSNWQINGHSYAGPSFNYCFTEGGNYTVFGSFGDANGCANTTSFVINAHETPVADFIYKPERPAETADEVIFKNISTGLLIEKTNWFFLDNASFKSTDYDVAYYFKEAGTFPVSLLVRNAWGCVDTIIKPIVVSEDFAIYVPNSFTPNDDNTNETFQPKGRGVINYNLIIFDRWGEKLFETNDFYKGWDGSFRGRPCKSETYEWKILASDKSSKIKNLQGHVTLYR